MGKDFRILIVCCAAVMAALLVVGVVSHGVIRHILQTSPLWIGIVLGLRNSPLTKWVALPCFAFWLLMMSVIWMFLLGWTRILSGTFSPAEIAMTLVVGTASIFGIFGALKAKGGVRVWSATVTTLLITVLQVTAFQLSFLPQIAHR